jgi:hypothetical protein
VRLELSHGYRDQRTLAAVGGVAVRHEFRLSQKPYASYEVIVDATSGDVGPGFVLRLVDAADATVRESVGVGGAGFSRTLRWANETSSTIEDQLVRVHSGACWTNCGSDDVYRVRAYETTYSSARFSNAGTQTTVLFAENTTDRPVTGHVHFWGVTGVRLHSEPFALPPKGLLTLPTAGLAPLAGQGGSITITHDAGYGGLVGKVVSLEPSTGLSFDTPLLPRPR